MLHKHLIAFGLLAFTGLAQAAETIDVYRDPTVAAARPGSATCATTASP